mmetsp:Transcript_18318/g.38324  ORF Transcript_18318/g.38324 Transcript_18318/m.38324 type:complete len:287 (-) Transcript_18318:552-1412(-)
MGGGERSLHRQRLLRRHGRRPHRTVEIPIARHQQRQGRSIRPANRGALPRANPPRRLSLPTSLRLQFQRRERPLLLLARPLLRVGDRTPRGPYSLGHLPTQELQCAHRGNHRPRRHGPHGRHGRTSDLRRVGGDQVPLPTASPARQKAHVQSVVGGIVVGAQGQLVRAAVVRTRLLPVVSHLRTQQLCGRARRLRQGRFGRDGAGGVGVVRPPREGGEGGARGVEEFGGLFCGRESRAGFGQDGFQGVSRGDDCVWIVESHWAFAGASVYRSGYSGRCGISSQAAR